METRIKYNPPYVYDADALSIHLVKAGGGRWFSVNVGEEDTMETRLATIFCRFGVKTLKLHLPDGQVVTLPVPEEAA